MERFVPAYRAATRPWDGILRLGTWFDVGVLLAVGLLLVALALGSTPINDEDQYIAGAVLATEHVPYRDFLYLQTPLQAWMFAPLVELVPDNPVQAMRVANALLGGLTLLLVYFAQRAVGAHGRFALVVTGLLALCAIFHESATLARNDMLSAALCAAGILAGVSAARRGERSLPLWALAGLALGLATSNKITYSLLLGGGGLFLLWGTVRGEAGLGQLVAYSVAGALGLLPTLVGLLLAPATFLYGVIEFGATGPFHYYPLAGAGEMLTLSAKLEQTLTYLSRGPALLGLLLVIALMLLPAGRPVRAEIAWLDALTVAGLAASLAPTPTYAFYLLPLLLPLFVRIGASGNRLASAPVPAKALLVAAFGIATLLAARSLLWSVDPLLGTPYSQWPTTRMVTDQRWVGARLRAADACGPVATISAGWVVGSGCPLDRRFATGAFVFRSADLIEDAEQRRLGVLSPRTLAGGFDADPPAAIVVGHGSVGFFKQNPDAFLRDYARSRGWRLERAPGSTTELWINPRWQAPAN